jgi:hypothetical protein
MAQSSLITATQTARKYLLYFAIFVVVVLLLQFCLNSLGAIFARRPGGAAAVYPYTDINSGFGGITLPAMTSIPISAKSTPIFSVDNNLPEYQFKGINVYKIEEPRDKFGSEDIAADVARRMRFTTAPQRDGTKLVWTDGQRRLEFEKVRQEWSYFNAGAAPEARFGSFSSDPVSYRAQASSLVKQLGLDRTFTDYETAEVDYLVKRGNSFVNATSPNTAQYIKIRIYRKFKSTELKPDLKELYKKDYPELSSRSVKDNYFTAPLEVITTAETSTRLTIDDVYSIKFIDWEFNPAPAVYEIMTAKEAWEKVQAGQGALKELSEIGFNRYERGQLPNQEVLAFTANYQQVELAYLEPDVWGGYIYPVYIFRGRAKLSNSPNQDNADFVFYVSALKEAPSQ